MKIEEDWLKNHSDVFKNNNEPVLISKSDFAKLLGTNENDRSLGQLFEMFAEDVSAIINLQKLMCMLSITLHL